MDDGFGDRGFRPTPTSDRPLLGLTILVVEDSRYSSEAMRLMCLRSGARIRRADSVSAARRHLNVYRPSAGIVDLGLPDGDGLSVIRRMRGMTPPVPIVLGTSGTDADDAKPTCLAAGAHGFLEKPVRGIDLFQNEILAHLPPDLRPRDTAIPPDRAVAPDPLTLREDLTHAMDLLALDRPPIGYLQRFLIGLARSVGDDGLLYLARGMGVDLPGRQRADLRQSLSTRIQSIPDAV